jgi:hypothetical protein
LFCLAAILVCLAIALIWPKIPKQPGLWAVGTWSGGSYPAPGDPYPLTLTIRADGTYTYAKDSGRWRMEGDTLVLASVKAIGETRMNLRMPERMLTDGHTDGLSFSKMR